MGREDRRGNKKSRDSFTKTRVPKLGYYYIVTDTDQTERNYLEGLRDCISIDAREQIVIKIMKARTVDMVETCRDGAALFPQYSEPWIVFDRDQVKNFDKIIKSAEENGIHVGWSNPCFEIWLYAYFGSMPNVQDSMSCNREFAIVYEKKVGQKYDKADKNLYKKLCQYGNEKNAIKIAEQKRKQCHDNAVTIPSKMIVCTTVDILVSELMIKIEKVDFYQ